MHSYISSIGISVPKYKAEQMDIAKFMAKAYKFNNGKEEKLFSLYKSTRINSRYSVIKDFSSKNGYSFFPNNEILEPFPTTNDRMNLYREEALSLSKEAALKCLDKFTNFNRQDITHLITISCTGMYAPGLDIELTRELKLKSSTKRTAINFMGCYAAINGLKMADAICKSDPDAKVLMVAVELCTIHFQKDTSGDSMMANALFADGAAAVLVEGKPREGLSLSLDKFVCTLDDDSADDMAWKIGDFGFEMKLSAYVPTVIQKGIRNLSRDLIRDISAEANGIDFYAIHPGGKKIIDVIETELKLESKDTIYSREILAEYGNMSSPTVLFVMDRISKALRPEDNQKHMLSFAFGPGLTLEGLLMKIHYN